MNGYTDGWSMRGSGIYSEVVEFEGFVCRDIDCLHHNQPSFVATDDWGNYVIECEACGLVQDAGNLSEEKEANEQAWREED